MDSLLVIGGIILLLLLCSAFFSGSETALTAVSEPRIKSLVKAGDPRGERVYRLWQRRERTLGAILIGNNLVNILSSALATALLIRLFGETGVVYATIVMTFLVVIFAEILPKTLAIQQPDAIAFQVSRPMLWIVRLFTPFSAGAQAIVGVILSPFQQHFTEDKSQVSEELLLGAIELHDEEQDGDTRESRDMLKSILDLDDVVVEQIMTHRKNVEVLDADLPPEELLKQILDSQYTRLPVFRGDNDNIVGVLHAKALLRALRAPDGSRRPDISSLVLDLDKLCKKPWFIPENTVLLDQLRAFRARREHFALVVDEYGALRGIVTLEDILEEIVGDIDDEHDTLVQGVYPQADGSVIVDGEVSIRDLNRRFEWQLADDRASTIAGLVLYESRQIPEVGQQFDFLGFRFRVLKRKRHQITSISIKPMGS